MYSNTIVRFYTALRGVIFFYGIDNLTVIELSKMDRRIRKETLEMVVLDLNSPTDVPKNLLYQAHTWVKVRNGDYAGDVAVVVKAPHIIRKEGGMEGNSQVREFARYTS